MNKELKITKEDLVSWLDRPPSNEDLDLCSYLTNALEKQQYYLIMNELKKWLCELSTSKELYITPLKVVHKIKELEEVEKILKGEPNNENNK